MEVLTAKTRRATSAGSSHQRRLHLCVTTLPLLSPASGCVECSATLSSCACHHPLQVSCFLPAGTLGTTPADLSPGGGHCPEAQGFRVPLLPAMDDQASVHSQPHQRPQCCNVDAGPRQ